MKTLKRREFLLGEKKNIGLFVNDPSGASLSSITGTVTIYDSAGTSVLASTAMSTTTSRPKKFYYLLTTGSAQTITARGTYTAYYELVYGTQEFIWKQIIEVV